MPKGIKLGGRVAGTPNKTTAETKALILTLVSNEFKNINALLDKLEPKDRIDAVIKLLPYIMPKQQDITIENKENVFKPITITLINPDDEN